MADFDGLVVRNTFLDFPQDRAPGGEEDEAIGRRPRAVSDLTDTKLPWKVPLSDHAEGLYQVTRRRLGSNAAESPAADGESALHTVKEEEDVMTMRRRGSRSSRAGAAVNSRRSRFDTAEMSPGTIPGLPPMPHFFPGPMAMGPPGAIPMLPGYHAPFGYPGMVPPWGQFPLFPYGLVPGMAPAALPQQGGSLPAGKSAGKGKQKRAETGVGEKGGAKAQRGGTARAQQPQQQPGGEGVERAKAAPSAPPQPPGEPTTVMLRNIPNRYTSGSLLALLDEHSFQSLYDFVYLPMDFQNGVNLGYAFVNLLRHQDALRFKEVFQGFQDWRFDSAKVSEVSWAHPHQGLEEHVERYRNSPVMHPSMPDEYKPMIFQSGARVAFPPPTRVIKAPKLRLGRDRPREPGREEASREGLDLIAAVA